MQQPRRFNGEGFFEDSFAPMPAGTNVRRIAIQNHLKTVRTSADTVLNKVDEMLNENQALRTYEAPPDKPRRPERYKHVDELPLALRIMAITAIDRATGQLIDLESNS